MKSITDYKGKAIYHPSGKAGEYSYWACNFYVGCSNKCIYCYCRTGILAGSMGYDKPQLKKCFRDADHAIELFEKEMKANLPELKKHGLFFSFTTDPMLPETYFLTLRAIGICLNNNVPVKVLTKRTDWLEDFEDRVHLPMDHKLLAFGFTLTGHDQLEPFANTNQERINAMQKLHDAGFKTWASIEPIIDVESSIDMIDAIRNHVDLVKIGLRSGKKYSSLELVDMIPSVDLLARVFGFKVYYKDSFLFQAKVSRKELPEYCVTRDFNMFNL